MANQMTGTETLLNIDYNYKKKFILFHHLISVKYPLEPNV